MEGAPLFPLAGWLDEFIVVLLFFSLDTREVILETNRAPRGAEFSWLAGHQLGLRKQNSVSCNMEFFREFSSFFLKRGGGLGQIIHREYIVFRG